MKTPAKIFKKLNQSGRSMIEMLGVLAIVGVLSIGGLMMYRRSMDQHKANSIFDDVNRFQFIIEESLDQLPEGDVDERDFYPMSGFEMTAANVPAEGLYYIDVYGIPKGVCEAMIEKGGETYTMYVNNLLYEGNEEICLGNNDIHFYFGNTEGLCSMPGEGDEECGDGCLCLSETGHSCQSDVRADMYPDISNQTKCCPSNKVNCSNHCVRPCAEGLIFDQQCQCVCPDPMKAYNVETGKCECRKSGSSVALVEAQNGTCGCADASFAWIPSLNKCSKLSCPGGEGGICYLDGDMCGVYCQNTNRADRVSCNNYCRPDLCPSNYPFEKLNVNGSARYWGGGYRWGCRITDKTPEDEGVKCYTMHSSFACFNDVGSYQCCSANSNLKCVAGLCDQSYCQNRFGTGVTYSTGYNNIGSCSFENGTIKCYPTDISRTNWNCYRTNSINIACATGCTTPPNCGKCSHACSGLGSLDSNGYCCVKHKTTGKTICRNGNDYYFKNGTTYDKCGRACSYSGLVENEDGSFTINSVSCVAGHCQPATCSEGWEYGNAGGVWGCVKGKLKCSYLGGNANSPNVCSYDGASCGVRCQGIDNTNCAEWSRKECAPAVTKNGTTKPACLYGKKVGTKDTDSYNYDCWCKGDDVYAETDTEFTTPYCCPAGQIFRGGACVLEQ